MEGKELEMIVRRIIEEAGKLIPFYMENEEDRRIANGNVSVCIIDDDGVIYGKMFGTNKIRAREVLPGCMDESKPGLHYKVKNRGI